MASERDFELLDNYLRHQLNEGERAAFEQKLEVNPELKNEYNLQQQIAEGLRQARIAELKTMLNNIPVPAAQGGTSLLAKLGIGIGATVLVGLGIYYFTSKEEATPVEQQAIVSESKPESTTPVTSEENQPKEETPVVTTTESTQKEEVKSSKQTKKNKPQEKPVEKPVIKAFDPSEENETSSETATEKIENSAKGENASRIPVETVDNNKKYTFHYQFKEGKLVLYGSFEKNLYEIMEFFSDNKRTTFLFYKNTYYLLEDQNDKIKPLSAINDPVLLNKLRAYRAN